MNIWVIYLDNKLVEYLDAVSNNLLDRYLDESGCDEKPISTLETGTRISFFLSISCSRQEQEFLSFNLSIILETKRRMLFFNLGLPDKNEDQD